MSWKKRFTAFAAAVAFAGSLVACRAAEQPPEKPAKKEQPTTPTKQVQPTTPTKTSG